MEIRLTLFKEIGSGISLNNPLDPWQINAHRFDRKNREANSSFFKQA